MCTRFLWRILREREHSVDQDFYREINIILILLQIVEKAEWTGLWWLWIGSGRGNV
jgi:hypothetical protein